MHGPQGADTQTFCRGSRAPSSISSNAREGGWVQSDGLFGTAQGFGEFEQPFADLRIGDAVIGADEL